MAISASYRMVALLMTDIEGSTRMWETEPGTMPEAMRRHDELVRSVAADHRGHVPQGRGEGDSALMIFSSAADACRAAADFTAGITHLGEEVGLPLRVRSAVHAGEILDGDENLYGAALNRCARIRAIAVGGQILVSETAQRLARMATADDLTYKSLGRVTLRDLLEPEFLYQLVRGDLAGDHPPPNSLDRVPHNLPVQLTPFVGRGEDIAAIVDIVRQHRQVTIRGPGGVGKTRVALQAAAELFDGATDGVWFVDLAAVEHDRDVFPALLKALGRNQSTDETTLIGDLAHSAVVLLFDNCEQVTEGVRALASKILLGAPNSRLLLTSRQALDFRGERIYPLGGLRVPLGGALNTADLIEAEAVQLLVDRVRQGDPSFSASRENGAAIEAIVRRLDGLPLAIELAASRLRIMSPAQLMARLTDIFAALGVGPADALPRQRTVEASIAWSFEMLAPDEADFFLALCHFASGWTLEAMESIHASLGLKSDVLGLIHSLSGKSMIVTGPGMGRMRMLVPLREFGLKRAQTDSAKGEAFLHWARTASQEAHEAPDRGLAFAQAETENLQSALDRAIAGRSFPEAFAICRSMYTYWYTSGQFTVGCAYLSSVLALAGADNSADCGTADPGAELYDMQGVLSWALGKLDAAEVAIREAARRWAVSGDVRLQGRAHTHLGMVVFRKGDLPQAEAELTAAYRAMRSHGSSVETARSATNLGNLYHEQGLDSKAAPYFEEALDLARHNEDRRTVRTVTQLLAEVALRQSDFDRAHRLLEESLEVAIRIQDFVGIAGLMLPACDCLSRMDEPEEAARAIGSLDAILAVTGQSLDPASSERRDALLAGLVTTLSEPRLRIFLRSVGGQPLALGSSVLTALRRAARPT